MPRSHGLRVWRSIAGVLMIVLLTAAADEDPEPAITLESEATIGLYDDADLVTLDIPVDIRAGLIGSLPIETLSVSLDGVQRPELTSAFTSEIKDIDTANPRLLVTVDTTKATEGEYAVELLATSAGDDPAMLRLRILHPAATLAEPGTLRIEIIRGPGGETKTPPLTLLEVAGRSRLSNISVSQVGDAVIGEDPQPGKLTNFATDVVVAPNGMADIEYELSDAFGVGKATGSLIIRANQLDEPITVDFEVTTRFAKWWIFVMAIVGLSLSWLVKVYLAGRIERAEAMDKVFALLETIDRETARRRDPGFRSQLRTIRVEVAALETEGNIATISSKLETAKTQLEEQRTLLSDRLSTAVTTVNQFRLLVAEVPEGLTEPISQVAQAAEDTIEDARLALAQDNASGADVAQARTEFEQGIRNEAGAWKSNSQALIAFIESPTVPLPQYLSPAATSSATGAQTALAAAASADTDIAAVIRALGTAFVAISTLADTLRNIADECRISAEILLEGPGRTEEAETVLVEAERLRTVVGEYEAARFDQGAAVVSALSDVLALLSHAISGYSTSEIPGVKRELAAGGYPRAARTAVRAARAAVAGEVSDAAIGSPAMLEASAYARRTVVGRTPERRLAPAAVASAPRPEVAAPTTRRYRNWGELTRAKALRWMVIAAILVGTAFVVFEGEFLGTPANFLGVFAWAFAIDVTADAVLTALQQQG